MVWAGVSRNDFAFVAGESDVHQLALSKIARRTYCGRCGSPLTVIYHQEPEEIDVTAGTLDDTAAVAPAYHIFWASKPIWLEMDDGLPRYDRFRPGTIVEAEG